MSESFIPITKIDAGTLYEALNPIVRRNREAIYNSGDASPLWRYGGALAIAQIERAKRAHAAGRALVYVITHSDFNIGKLSGTQQIIGECRIKPHKPLLEMPYRVPAAAAIMLHSYYAAPDLGRTHYVKAMTDAANDPCGTVLANAYEFMVNNVAREAPFAKAWTLLPDNEFAAISDDALNRAGLFRAETGYYMQMDTPFRQPDPTALYVAR